MSTRCYSGEREVAAIDPRNRGMAYGDGLFETMRVHDGGLPLWPRHLARLREGAQRLGIGLPDVPFIEARITEMIGATDAGVLKLLLTRGEGGRGYAPPADAQPVWLLALHPLPAVPGHGLRLRWCDMRLASRQRATNSTTPASPAACAWRSSRPSHFNGGSSRSPGAVDGCQVASK